MSTLVLRSEDIQRLLTIFGPGDVMRRMIDRLSDGLARLGEGKLLDSPARSGFQRASDSAGVIETMPHYWPGSGVTVKLISYSPMNRQAFKLPTVLGCIVRINEENGTITAIADAGLLTAVRTGAASAVATRLLASPRSHTLGVVGAGAQAVTQVHALSAVLDLTKVLVFDTNLVNAGSLGDRVRSLDLEVERTTTIDMLERSDVICTATSVAPGEGPVFADGAHLPHLHVNAIGADEVGKTELPRELLQRAFVCVDHADQARIEGESQQLAPDQLGPSLSELCANSEAAVAHRDRLTVFDSTGFALEDHLALDVFLDLAQEVGLGDKIPLLCCPEDVYDPYRFSA